MRGDPRARGRILCVLVYVWWCGGESRCPVAGRPNPCYTMRRDGCVSVAIVCLARSAGCGRRFAGRRREARRSFPVEPGSERRHLQRGTDKVALGLPASRCHTTSASPSPSPPPGFPRSSPSFAGCLSFPSNHGTPVALASQLTTACPSQLMAARRRTNHSERRCRPSQARPLGEPPAAGRRSRPFLDCASPPAIAYPCIVRLVSGMQMRSVCTV